MNSIIKLENITKSYHTVDGEINAIDNVSFNVKNGEIISLVGPSGCGKSTLLSIISGLDNEYSGKIVKGDIKIAYMLQNDALLPFLTVYENAILGLKINKLLSKENLEYVNYLFNLYNLEEFKNSYPKSLSGGMKQRVALIRTLALKPDLLLLDEPFSALDEQSRLLITNDIYNIIQKENKTAILVTHNIEEAIYFSDKVLILSKRPSCLKKVVNINMKNKENIYVKRKDNDFFKYFDIIWKELDNNE